MRCFFLQQILLYFWLKSPQIPRAKCAYLEFHGICVANLIIIHIQFNKLHFCETLELFSK